MKKKLPSHFSAAQKAEILQAAAAPGCIISDLAKSYGVGRGSIYAWLHQQKKGLKIKQQNQASEIIPDISEPRFLEVSVTEQERMEPRDAETQLEVTARASPFNTSINNASTFKTSSISKISVVFSNFSLDIKGNISASTIISILKVLEEEK